MISMLLLGVGCVHSHAEVKIDAASQFLKCPATQIQLSPFAGDTDIAAGCGRTKMVTCGTFPLGGEQCFPMQDLQTRAGFELGCDPSAVKLTPLDGTGWLIGVNACGRSAVYQYLLGGDHYDWRLSSRSDQSTTPPGSAPVAPAAAP